jgi:hypothetical protein
VAPAAAPSPEQQQRRQRRLERHRDPEEHGREHRPAAPLGDPARDQAGEQQRVDLAQYERAVQR